MQKSETMSVYHAIYGRRMAWSFKETEVSRSAIERMLDAAVWAPNHRMTEPWRFVVSEKDSPTRRKTSDLAYAAALERSDNTRRAAAAREKVLAPPYIIYAYATPGPDEKTTKENYAAVCCAVQNIALAGAAEGLAVTWDTGGVTRHAELKSLLGAEDDWELTAMLMIGFPRRAFHFPPDSRVPVRAVARRSLEPGPNAPGLSPPAITKLRIIQRRPEAMGLLGGPRE